MAQPTTPSGAPADDRPAIDYSKFVTEDGVPVENIFSEKQMRLLVEPLANWEGPGQSRPFFAACNVGVFANENEPAVAPDAFLSLDAAPGQPIQDKPNRSYFTWQHGKPPDVVIEVMSGSEGDELSDKLRRYERMRVPYYVVYDPAAYITPQKLHRFVLHGGEYRSAPEDEWFIALVGLGLVLWDGEYERVPATWLRWCDRNGRVIPTGHEYAETAEARAETAEARAETAEARAETAEARAETADARAARLEAKLRALGIDPERD